MGLGGTAKKIQKMIKIVEKTYKRLNELRSQVKDLKGTVEETGNRVEILEKEIAEQRAILDAIAMEYEIDLDAVANRDERNTESADDMTAASQAN